MNREDIIRMAQEAGLWPTEEWSKEYGITTPNEQFLPELERFAALVAAAEREACAKVVEAGIKNEPRLSITTAHSLAAAIRARGQE